MYVPRTSELSRLLQVVGMAHHGSSIAAAGRPSLPGVDKVALQTQVIAPTHYLGPLTDSGHLLAVACDESTAGQSRSPVHG